MSRTTVVDGLRSGDCTFRILSVASTLILLALNAGCGEKGPPPIPREKVAGMVQFDGKPIPFGYIDFRNEETKVITTLQIKDGAFSGGSKDGPVAGKNVVIIAGKVKEDGMPLWSGEYKTQVEIKKGENNGTDFSVDKKAVKPYDPKNWSDNIHDRL